MPRQRARRWLLLALIASGCGVRFAACEPPDPALTLPVKLWSCNTLDRHCEVFARFQSINDCDLYRRFLYAECDPKAPAGEIRCRRTTRELYLGRWFHKCSPEDLTFEQVRDGGWWVE